MIFALVFVYTLAYGDLAGTQQAAALDAFRTSAQCEAALAEWEDYIMQFEGPGDQFDSYCLPVTPPWRKPS